MLSSKVNGSEQHSKEIMALASSLNHKQLSMLSANKNVAGHTKSMIIRPATASSIFSEGSVEALSDKVNGAEQHPKEIMTLASGLNYTELSMVAANKNETGHTKFMTMGVASASKMLNDWEFKALSDKVKGTKQHFHLIGINCK